MHHILRYGDHGLPPVTEHRHGLCLHHLAETVATETLQLLIVRSQQDITVLKTDVLERLAIIHTHLHVLQGQVRIAPRKQDHGINKQSQQEVEHHARYHNHQTLSGRLGAELVRLGRLGHRLLVHTLVDHTGDLTISSQRKPAYTVFRVTVFRLVLE